MFLLARSSLPERLAQAWENRHLSALQRGARIGFGDRFARHMAFLRTNIPDGRPVLLPPEQVDETLSHVGLMQFLVFPRPVFNCSKSQSIEDRRPRFRLAGTNTRGRDSKNLSIRLGSADRDEVCE